MSQDQFQSYLDIRCAAFLNKNRIHYNYTIVMAKSGTRSATTRSTKTPPKSKDIAKDKPDSPLKPPAKRGGKRQQGKKELDEVREAIAHDYELQLEEDVYKVRLHQNYELRKGDRLYTQIARLFELFIQKEQRRCLKTHRVIPHSNFPSFEFSLQGEDPTTIKCSICQFQFQQQKDFQVQLGGENDQDVMTLPCSHLLHRGCFQMLKGDNQWIKCPVCSSIYGMMVGDQSPGTMHTTLHPHVHCDGFPDVGTHIINYSMSSGKRGEVHFSGTHRTAYLPDTAEGREVLSLLQEAFRRKLIFTVGRSVTTGRDNTVVWNGIHHKTNLSGGSAYFGFPDDTYFERVKLELAMKGIYAPVSSPSVKPS